jgi:hypothetical protein
MEEVRIELDHGAVIRIGVGPKPPRLKYHADGPVRRVRTDGFVAIDSRAAGTMLVTITRVQVKNLIVKLCECWEVSGLELDDLTEGL